MRDISYFNLASGTESHMIPGIKDEETRSEELWSRAVSLPGDGTSHAASRSILMEVVTFGSSICPTPFSRQLVQPRFLLHQQSLFV